MSPVEQEIDDYESLPKVKRQDAYVTIEEGDGKSFLSMQEYKIRQRYLTCRIIVILQV